MTEARAKIHNRLEKIYETALKDHPECGDIVKSIEICDGYPVDKILDLTEKLCCDMIVMGTHSKGMIRHTFLGSTAKKVLRRSRKPVWIIPLPREN
jgi:nucleotide-binding universal stress UspA family protein